MTGRKVNLGGSGGEGNTDVGVGKFDKGNLNEERRKDEANVGEKKEPTTDKPGPKD